ncbi:aspartate/glutamate racemase family protein [Proteiniclasticum sp. C24MP]|uniref:aspartate/glutamate racemase family protein n=1 Tax=Proteiniclasticum sp. C24MP TaxID=3374101 RepID=UPI003754CCEE
MKEKTLGIIGGMGPEATAQLYMKIIKATKVKKDQEHFRIVIDSNPKIPDRTKAILGLGESPVPYIIETANNIEKMGADIACIPCITSHYFYDEIIQGTDLRIIHALEELNLYIHKEFPGTTKIGVLATTGTKNTRIFDRYLKDVSIIYPDDHVQEECVMEAIYGEGTGIKSGVTDGKPVELLKKAGEHVIENGAEVVILGCTEIGLVLSRGSLSRPSIDPMDVMAEVMIAKGREE